MAARLSSFIKLDHVYLRNEVQNLINSSNLNQASTIIHASYKNFPWVLRSPRLRLPQLEQTVDTVQGQEPAVPLSWHALKRPILGPTTEVEVHKETLQNEIVRENQIDPPLLSPREKLHWSVSLFYKLCEEGLRERRKLFPEDQPGYDSSNQFSKNRMKWIAKVAENKEPIQKHVLQTPEGASFIKFPTEEMRERKYVLYLLEGRQIALPGAFSIFGRNQYDADGNPIVPAEAGGGTRPPRLVDVPDLVPNLATRPNSPRL